MEHKTVISRMGDLDHQEVASGEDFHFFRHKFIKGEDGYKSNIAFLRLPPKKAAFPLHYHEYSEETFYIISGAGRLNLANGETQKVVAGDIAFFPTGEAGAHQIVNDSETEDLVYIDFDTYVPLDITYYPSKDKIGIFGETYTGVLKKSATVGLFEGEEVK